MFFKRKTRAIPQQWITAVSEKLKRGSDSEIEWTQDAFERWHLYGKRGDAYDAMSRALVPGIVGKQIRMPVDEGETYAFFFTARNQGMYGKICLKRDGRLIIIYSAHEQERAEL